MVVTKIYTTYSLGQYDVVTPVVTGVTTKCHSSLGAKRFISYYYFRPYIHLYRWFVPNWNKGILVNTELSVYIEARY